MECLIVSVPDIAEGHECICLDCQCSYIKLMLQNLRMECIVDPLRTVRLEDFVAFFDTVSSTHAVAKLPPDAGWRVCHPDSRALWLWDAIIRMVALYFFWFAAAPYLIE